MTSDNPAGGNWNDSSRAVDIDASGNVVVASYNYNGIDVDMTLWRYTSSELLDTTFISTGIVVNDGAAR